MNTDRHHATARVAINGFGRTGRQALRAILRRNPTLELAGAHGDWDIL